MPNNLLRPDWRADMDEAMLAINSSLAVDKELFEEDIDGSLAHVAMLVKQQIIDKESGDKIATGLEQIRTEIKTGQFVWRPDLEDIHINIENRLHELIGATAGRLHTARSRNDQVATDSKLWLRRRITATIGIIKELRHALITLANDHVDTLMPGYTHLQVAQVISLAHHLMAYYEMLSRDQQRFLGSLTIHDDCPLGAVALAGTSFNIDRHSTASALGFAKPASNSLDAVSSRDFMLDFLAAASIHLIHLSRLAEELVLWSSPHFGFVEIADAWSSISSIMPQKKNPDAAELVRAKVAKLLAAFQQLAVVMKALPLSYAKDMQEDKECLFDAATATTLAQRAMLGMLTTIKINKQAMARAAAAGHATATDLADLLVREQHMPFREAYRLVAQVVRRATELSLAIYELPANELQAIDNRLTLAMTKNLTPAASMAAKQSWGGTGPHQVRAAIAAAKQAMAQER